jgi:hypothetical protein
MGSVLGPTQLVLIILKLFGLIRMSWWLVFIPTYVFVVLLILIVILAVLGAALR